MMVQVLFWSVSLNFVFAVVIVALGSGYRNEHRERIYNLQLARAFGGMVKRLKGWNTSEYEMWRREITRRNV
ncbi:MAG: hypothetical protein ACREQA_19710 [Candidatus Binatia bacterium]